MLSKFIKPGLRVDLVPRERVNFQDEEMEKKVHRSQIYEIVSDDELEVAMPIEKGKLILLPVDKEFEVFFYTEKGLYQCFATVTNRFKRNNIYMITLELESELKKHQRRDYYRFSCSLELNVRGLENTEEEALLNSDVTLVNESVPMRKGVIADISGGGMRYLSTTEYKPGTYVLLKWYLLVNEMAREFEVIGKILYTQALENRKGVYEHRLQYVKIEKTTQEEIIRYIFEEERKSRQRETGL